MFGLFKKVKIVFIYACLISPYAAWAQNSFRLESITVDDGLSQSRVTSLVQDKLGYLWIGTMDGLNRYDGQDIKIYRHRIDDTTTLAHNEISKVFLDRQNNLWIGAKGVLSRYNPQTDGFEHFPIFINPEANFAKFSIDNIVERHDGTFILSYLNANSANLPGFISFNPNNGTYFIQQDFKDLGRISFCVESKKLGTWIFYDDSVRRYIDENHGWEKKKFTHGNIMFVKHDMASDRIFITYNHSGKNTLAEFIPATGNLVEITDKAGFFTKVLVRSNGEVWFGGHMLNILYPSDSTVKLVDKNNFIASELYETADGVVWIGTSGFGLKKFNPLTNRFSYLGKNPDDSLSLSNNYIGPIYTADDNTLYVATFNGLNIVNLKENKTEGPKFSEIFKKDKALGFFINREDSLAINFSYSGSFDVKTSRKIEHIPPLFAQIHKIDADDYISISAYYIVRHNQNKKDTLYARPVGGSIGTVSFIQGDTLWLTQLYEGLILLDINSGKILRRFSYSPGNDEGAPSGELVKCIFQDSKNNIWLGTLGMGLCLYEPQKQRFKCFSVKDGLPNNVIYGILEDDDNNLWLSTNNGICKFTMDTYKTINFDVLDGLQSNEFNTNSYFKSASGTMYFGGVNGLTYFHPKDIELKESTPKSIISGVYINNQKVNSYYDFLEEEDGQQVLKIPKEGRDFGFNFVGLSFSMPGRINYRYMLENYDKEWHDIGKDTHVNFTNIPPGKYIFRVKAADSHGNWEPEGASMVVYIDLPFWKKPLVWAYTFTLLFGLGMIAHRIRMNNLQKTADRLSLMVDERTFKIQRQNQEIASQNEELIKQSAILEDKNKELEKARSLLELEVKYFHQRKLLITTVQTQEEERKRISKDLHDELGAVLSITRMYLVQSRNSNKSIEEIKENLKEACVLTETAMATMRRISHELMPPLLEKFGLIKTIQSMVKQINETKEMFVDFNYTDANARWTASIELGLYRICMELINNTLKHAQANNISLKLTNTAEEVALYYSDDGIGLSKPFNRGLGFINIETRTNIMGGTFEILPNQFKGFSASVKVPNQITEI